MSFRLERARANGGLPVVRERPVASGEAWTDGALLTVNSNGEYAEVADSDPALATIAAVAKHPVGTGSAPFAPTGTLEFPPGRAQAFQLDDEITFTASYLGTLPATAGGSYGVGKNAAGQWCVDFADTTNTRVRLIDIDWTRSPLNVPRVVVKFLPGFMVQG